MRDHIETCEDAFYDRLSEANVSFLINKKQHVAHLSVEVDIPEVVLSLFTIAKVTSVAREYAQECIYEKLDLEATLSEEMKDKIAHEVIAVIEKKLRPSIMQESAEVLRRIIL